MSLFLLGIALGLALSVAVLIVLVWLDKRRWPECQECAVLLPTGYASRLCPRCTELAIMAKGEQP